MPNGHDKNWIRLRIAIDGFFAKHQEWPTRIRLNPLVLRNLKEDLFPESFSQLEAKLEFVADASVGVVAEDDQGRSCNYAEHAGGARHRPDASEWLGVEPEI